MEWSTDPESGGLSWYYDDEFVWSMSASSFGAYETCSSFTKPGGEQAQHCTRTPQRQIPREPMSLVMNTAIGTWNGGVTAVNGEHWPADMFVDYVRVWQKKGETNVGCNPPDFPTKTYIEKNAVLYGEPAEPSGYATCPEVYPASAFAHAEQLEARASVVRASRAAAGSADLAGAGSAEAKLALFASSTSNALKQAPQAGAARKRSLSSFGVGFGALCGLAALVVSAVAVAGMVAQRKALSASKMGSASEDEMLGSYHPASVYELAGGK